jgi:wyosine [tRNA(Phe)-imidazoG37] synthetase (radical SAM superfamily)
MDVAHVFGPVPSRRLGLSLGVDPVAPKTCTMDCVYCELGPTTVRTVCRAPYVDVDEILRELKCRLAESPRIDFVTLSGSGEPTLNSDLGRLIVGIRRATDLPIAVLTNGSLMTDSAVCEAIGGVDVVAPSLDAASQAAFEAVNRPDPSLDVGEIATAIAAFARRFAGKLWLETLFVAGLNDGSADLRVLGEAIDAIQPDRVHVNTIVRPPSDPNVKPVAPSHLREIARALGSRAEVIAGGTERVQMMIDRGSEELVVAMAARRPVTAEDIARAIGTSQAEAAKLVSALTEKRVLTLVRHGGKLYYRTTPERG